MQHEGLVVDARKLQRGRSAIGLRVKGLRRLRCDERFVLPQGKPPWSFAQSFGRTRDYGILDAIDLIRQQRRHVGTHPRRGPKASGCTMPFADTARPPGVTAKSGAAGAVERPRGPPRMASIPFCSGEVGGGVAMGSSYALSVPMTMF